MKEHLDQPEISSRRLPILKVVFWLLILIGAYSLFVAVRDLTACWRLTSMPGLPPAGCAEVTVKRPEARVPANSMATAVPTSTLEPPVPEVEYPTWDDASRINILFVGLRGNFPNEDKCPFCTDTLILLTIDPSTKTAGMLSIPRDMWINIPGFGYSRINTAWTLGRASKLPGGGPALAMETVSQFIGVPVDYYVQVDFDTFIDAIDLLGGVDIYNDETLLLDPVSHGVDYPKVKLTCCGERHLNGRTALAYARCRNLKQGCDDGDFGRARRQQKVIFAIRDKILDPENFPALMAQAPELYATFSAGIQTNLSFNDALKLAVLVRDIPKESIRSAVIDTNSVIPDSVMVRGVNASILRPIPEKIRALRDQIFGIAAPIGPLAQGYPAQLMLEDAARIRILNGTTTPQLDAQTGELLKNQGLKVIEYGDLKPINRTVVVLYSPKLYTLRYLMDIFGITSSTQILIRPDPSQTVDIEIRLGKDWVGKLPGGY
jgi:LCP family protein required for cell wall assembly